MIETADGMANLDEIVTTPGLDGVYIGPADLTLGLTGHDIPTGFDREEPEMVEAIQTILGEAHAAGIRACLHCGAAAYAARAIGWGFDLVTLLNDVRLLAAAAQANVAATRQAIGKHVMTEAMLRLTPNAARKLIFNALTGAGTSAENARYFTEAILDTEFSGLKAMASTGCSIIASMCKSGKVDGMARPTVNKLSPVAFRVDAGAALPIRRSNRASTSSFRRRGRIGIAAMAVHNSYNAATLGFHTGYLAKQGLAAFGFTNSTPAIAPVGGQRPVIGTNPLSFAVPGKPGKIAFLIDQSSSAVAWTAVKRAAKKAARSPWAGRSIATANPPPIRQRASKAPWRLPAVTRASARA